MSQTDKWQQAFRDAYEGIPIPTESTDGWAAVSGTVARRAVRRRVALISVAVIPMLCVGIAGMGFFFRPATSVSDPASTLAVVSSSTQLSPSA
ncbi:MAG: hypothetical protein PUA47_08095, partial [Bacteroidales bacterium]|nr:hypothetical protein [Bacteroidales bacterium]